MMMIILFTDDQIFGWGSNRHGRLGCTTSEEQTWKPQCVEIEEQDVEIQALSVSNRTTLLAGKGAEFFLVFFMLVVVVVVVVVVAKILTEPSYLLEKVLSFFFFSCFLYACCCCCCCCCCC